MLPSKGFFASYYCPFFEQGSCKRTYCHFHHRKKMKSSEIRRCLKASQAKHAKPLEQFEEFGNKLDKRFGRAEYCSAMNGTGITYTPTPIAILKKRNTTGCNNSLEIEEEIIIKKQKTQISNGLESGEDSEYSTQNIVKTEGKTVSSTIIERQPLDYRYESSNNIEMSQNKINCPMLGSLYAEGISFNNHEKSCEQQKDHFQPETYNQKEKENFLNHSINSHQTNLNLAGDKSETLETNTSNIEKFPLGFNDKSFLDNILEGKRNDKYFGYCVEKNCNERSYNDENEDPASKMCVNLENNSCITTNKAISNDIQLNHTPRETYANIVKQDRNLFNPNKNNLQYKSDTSRKVGNNRVLTNGIAINNHKAHGLGSIANKNDKKYTITNVTYNKDNSYIQDKYSVPSNSLQMGEKSNISVINEELSGLDTYETQSSIIRSINVKQRISHSDSTEEQKSILSNETPQVMLHCSPSHVLLERWKTARTMSKKNNGNKELAPKMRIAYVPNVAALLAERQRIANSLIKPCQIRDSDSSSSKIYEGVSLSKKDLLLESVHNSKIPFIKRQIFLNRTFEIYSKLYSYETAISKAVDTEKEICSISRTPTTYSNKFAHLFMRLKKDSSIKNDLQKTSIKNSHSLETGKGNKMLLYNDLLKYILYDLEDNGIPVPHPQKIGFAKMKKIYGVSSYNKNKSICINCSKEFEVDSAGYSIERNCKFHSGKMYKQRRKYGTEKIWSCCTGDEESGGCVENELHVRDMVDYDNIPGFKQVREPTVTFEEACQVYALDCEMCYTTEGSELTRCTVVDSNLEVVYDKLCVPDLPIIDYCTKFSGISEGDLDNISTKLTDIQADLLNLFTTETILIGHGIGNDLKAVKLFHRSVIDTNVVYGNFRKHKLSDLTREILYREIQVSGTGHNSCEDAIATMELMLVKVKEDRKASMPRSRTGL